jgi:hypothetical protein
VSAGTETRGRQSDLAQSRGLGADRGIRMPVAITWLQPLAFNQSGDCGSAQLIQQEELHLRLDGSLYRPRLRRRARLFMAWGNDLVLGALFAAIRVQLSLRERWKRSLPHGFPLDAHVRSVKASGGARSAEPADLPMAAPVMAGALHAARRYFRQGLHRMDGLLDGASKPSVVELESNKTWIPLPPQQQQRRSRGLYTRRGGNALLLQLR